MEQPKSLINAGIWISKVAVATVITGSLIACNDNRANTPDEVVATPSPVPTQTVVVSPTPVPTQTVVVTPSPIPTQTVVVTPTPGGANNGTVSEPIADVGIIARTPNQQSLANKQVQLTNVTAQSVVGDRTFWVGSNNVRQLFVVLSPPLDAGNAENRIVVKPGQTLSVSGVLKPMPSPQQAETEWGLSAEEVQAIGNQTLYLQANQIRLQS